MSGKWSFTCIALILIPTLRAEDINGGFIHDGYYRTYILHVPPRYNESDSFPLVINMHGGYATPGPAALYAPCTRMNQKADSEGFLVVYPNATMLPMGSVCWNSGERFQSDVDDVGFISTLIDTLRESFAVDTLRIYACGFSGGGWMSHRLACELSEKIAAVGPVSGGLILDDWNGCQPQRLISIMHIQARNDNSGAPYYGNSTTASADSVMRFWAERLGCSIGPDTFYNDSGALRQTWKRADDSCEVVFWTTEDGGHSWPGGYPFESGGDVPSDDISANDLLWEFFLAHPIPAEESEPGIAEAPACVLDPSNPGIFASSAEIRFLLERTEHVSLKLFDVQGRRLAVLLDQKLAAGRHEAVIDAAGLPCGAYFYELKTPTVAVAKSIIIVK